MGKGLKIWAVIVLTILYCSAIGLSNHLFDPSFTAQSLEKEERYHSSVLGGLLIHLSSEVSCSNFKTLNFLDFEKPYKGFAVILKLGRNLNRALLVQYIRSSLGFQIEQHKAILFSPSIISGNPFNVIKHCLWQCDLSRTL